MILILLTATSISIHWAYYIHYYIHHLFIHPSTFHSSSFSVLDHIALSFFFLIE